MPDGSRGLFCVHFESKLGVAAAAHRRRSSVEVLLLIPREATDGDFCDGDGHDGIVVHRLHL